MHSRFSFISNDPEDLQELIDKGVIAADPPNPSAGCECESRSENAPRESVNK